MKHDWIRMKKEFEDRLEEAVPADLKDFVGLVDAKGYCDLCHQKKVLLYERDTKKSLCIDCRPAAGYEYTAIEFDNMWQLIQDTLFYTNEIIMELSYPNLDFEPVTPEKMKTYLASHGWIEEPVKNENIWMFWKMHNSVKISVAVPAITDLVDYQHAVELFIEFASKVENKSQYEVFKDISAC